MTQRFLESIKLGVSNSKNYKILIDGISKIIDDVNSSINSIKNNKDDYINFDLVKTYNSNYKIFLFINDNKILTMDMKAIVNLNKSNTVNGYNIILDNESYNIFIVDEFEDFLKKFLESIKFGNLIKKYVTIGD